MISFDGLSSDSIVSINDLCGLLKVSEKTIKRMVDRNELPPSFKLGAKQSWRIETIKLHFVQLEKQQMAKIDKVNTIVERNKDKLV